MKHSQIFKRSIAALLTLAMAVSLCAVFAGSSEAATSLPAVETLKQSASEENPYTILEIVPDATQGSIGYYIDGQEPWRLAAGNKSTAGERAAFVNGLRADFTRSGGSGDGVAYTIALCDPASSEIPDGATKADYPLNWSGAYSEKYPWDMTSTEMKNYQALKLDHIETKSGRLSGYMKPVENGEYNVGTDCILAGTDGTHSQIIGSLSATASGTKTGYWYNVSFSVLQFTHDSEDENINSIPKYTLVYRTPLEDETPSLTYEQCNVVGGLVIVGVTGTDDFPGLETGTATEPVIYYRAVCSAPSESESASKLWASAEYGFYENAGGAFSPLSYEYVGAGKGAYSFVSADENGKKEDYKVSTRIIYFMGGPVNNNWFAKFSMDWDEDDGDLPAVKVNTVAYKSLTLSDVTSADLIIIGYGFNLGGNTYKTVYCNDFKGDSNKVTALGRIISYATGSAGEKKPVVVDYSLAYGSPAVSGSDSLSASSSSEIKTAAQQIITAAQNNRKNEKNELILSSGSRSFVGGSVYVMDGYGKFVSENNETTFWPGIPLVSRRVALSEYGIENEKPLEIVNFSSTELGLCSGAEDAFYPVAEGIKYENFLRRVRYGKDYTSLKNASTTATTLRYIINAAKAREIDNKTIVRLLDIEPRTGSISADQKSSIANWLGLSSTDNLQVTTMSSTEYNAIQADICEQFDMVYIGASESGFKYSADQFTVGAGWFGIGGTTYKFKKIDYNDSAMTYSGSVINSNSISGFVSRRVSAGFWGNISDASDTVFGMRYTNVGDTIQSGGNSSMGETGYKYRLAGMLDRDFNTKLQIICQNNAQLFRLSGNDLTSASSKKLQEFADLGYPIVFSDTLLKPPEYSDTKLTSLARIWLEGSFSGADYANIAYVKPIIKSDGDVLTVYLDTPNPNSLEDTFYRWKIRSGIVSLYQQIGDTQDTTKDTLIDSEVQSRGNYAVSFDLSDYETSEDNLIQTGTKFYCTYRILSCFQPFADLISGITGRLIKISRQNGYTQTVTIRGDAEEMFVDSASEMFTFINNLTGRFNVMSYSSLSGSVISFRRTLLPKLVNLSKPEIVFYDSDGVDGHTQDEYPTAYISTSANGMTELAPDDGKHTLEFKFKIQNDADPSPGTTRYRVDLYIDSDGNGKYTSDELVSNLPIRKLTVYAGGTSVVGDRIENDDLMDSYGVGEYSSSSQNYYYAYFTLPSEVQGLVPWKLSVTEVYSYEKASDDGKSSERINVEGSHDSVTDYTRVAGTAKTIRVLQIDSDRSTDSSKNLNLTENLSSNKIYSELLDDVESDFIIEMTTIAAGDYDDWTTTGKSYKTHITGSGKDSGDIAGGTTFAKSGTGFTQKIGSNTAAFYSDLSKLFQSYDMIIIGFGDAYAELGVNGATALSDYIRYVDANGNKKAVLMAHDTTSFYSYENYNMDTSSGKWRPADATLIERAFSEHKVYGYYTNSLVRDLIGMDRYGVSSLKPLADKTTVGLTKFAGITTDGEDTSLYYNKNFLDYVSALTNIPHTNYLIINRSGFVSSTNYTNSSYLDLVKSVGEKGYAIAWAPGTRSKTGTYSYGDNIKTVSETQGLASSVLFRFLLDGTSAGSYSPSYDTSWFGLAGDTTHVGRTNEVTQINGGQITTYPYYINTAAFSKLGNGTSGTGALQNSQEVPTTHGQNYQLNLNYSADGKTSDMIVWYCLANPSSGTNIYQEGDVVNNYYVYTVDNVTYTGAGHTTSVYNNTYAGCSAATQFEAKLFVNTMLAAYRADLSTSDVSFTDKTGTETGISDFFVITDGDTILTTDSATHAKDETRNIYFTANKTATLPEGATQMFFSATFAFGDTSFELPIYNADTGEAVTNGQLQSTYTYFVKFDELLKKLGTTSIAEINGKGLTLNVAPVYLDAGGQPVATTEHLTPVDLTFRQYKLFDLS